MTATKTRIKVGSRVAEVKNVKPKTYPQQPMYNSLGGRLIRVGVVVEINGERARVKWEYGQFKDNPKVIDGKRTWIKMEKLTTVFTENN
jgi:hypothetical protein